MAFSMEMNIIRSRLVSSLLSSLAFVALHIMAFATVSIEESIDEGVSCFIIRTETATYHYQKNAGGFSSIEDIDGNDWIAFHKSGNERYPDSAASDYRGLPNLVFKSDDGGVGHPGFEKCVSFITGPDSIRTLSKSGKWAWTWQFTDTDATLTVDQADPDHAYWFLYEGPIAGKFDPANQYWGNSHEGPIFSFSDYVKGEKSSNIWNWVYFGTQELDRIFIIEHLTPDALPDMAAYMGNTREGLNSPDGMIVFGFGRYLTADPLMTRTPNRFRISFREQSIKTTKDHGQLVSALATP